MLEIRLRCNTEVINDILFTKALLIFRVKKLPGPVLGLVDLLCSFCVTLDAGLRYLGARFKMNLQFLELAVISRGCRKNGDNKKK